MALQKSILPTPPLSDTDGDDVGSKNMDQIIIPDSPIHQLSALSFASSVDLLVYCEWLTVLRLLSGPLTHISVGKDYRKEWSIHRRLLVHRSPYFAERLHGTDAKDNLIELKEDSPAAFEIFVKWLYQGIIDDVSSLELDKKWDYAFACQQLYHLSERLGISQLQNAAIDQFRRGCYEAGLAPGPEEMLPVYANTLPGSPFRRLISRIAARQILDPDAITDASTYRQCFESNADFAIDVVNAIKAGVGGKLIEDPTEFVGCEYHDHSKDSTCLPQTRALSPSSSILK